MILSPEQYKDASPYELLTAAARGHVGMDHRWLEALIGRPEETARDLVRFGAEDHEEDPEDLGQDLQHLCRHLKSAATLPLLVQWINADRDDVSFGLIETYRGIGTAAIEPLAQVLDEQAAGTEAGFVLANLGVRDPRVFEALVAYLEVDPVDASHCLAAYGDPAGAPLLRAKAAAISEEWQKDSIEQAARRLEHPEPETVADEAFDLWSEYPDIAEPRFDLMEPQEFLEFLESPEADYRGAAISALSADEMPKKLVNRIFEQAKADPDAFVRGRCWQALAAVWDRTEIRQAIEAKLNDETVAPEERGGALVAAAENDGDDPKVQQRMLELYEQPETRFRALQAMALSADPRFEKYVTRHLDDEDLRNRMQAVQGVGFLEITNAAPRLVPLFEDDDFREEALTSYAMAADAQLSRRGVRQLLEKIERLAGGLDAEEELAVRVAINFRLLRYEMAPLFDDDGNWIEEEKVASDKVGRNDPCPCGSGKKFKKCCGA